MKYFYYASNGEKKGPFPETVIKLLAQNGVITPETAIEDEAGKCNLAQNVKGLTVRSVSKASKSVSDTEDVL